ncbi:pyruvate ferredoxin oxidoreductase [Candidatus Bathyarchaeota archaeon]|nr:2-oxoacid:acceptor oxidoreductase family protein [Candidatus Bathyarchaeota archaeon]TFH14296.1 MAG: pyruvate ferredoxin oxidoreductase [Candidatus Bathyarchaeota archaeon]
MYEVRFHGRGGQGAWTASLLLAQAGLNEEKNIQSFPAFGPERAGAPITAFTRISDEKIQIHSSIYEPDVVVVLDPTLLGPAVAEGVQKKTKIIVNTDKSAKEVLDILGLKGIETWTVDATTLAINVLGRPITNTAMLGSVVKATGVVKLDSMLQVVKERFDGKISELNAELVKKAYEEVKRG